MFLMADTKFGVYKINTNAENDEYTLELFSLLGKIIGKALFERIPINCYLDKTIINYILGKNNQISDIYYYDENVLFLFPIYIYIYIY